MPQVYAQKGTRTDSEQWTFTIDVTKAQGERLGLPEKGCEWIRGVGCRGAWSTEDVDYARHVAAAWFGQNWIFDVITSKAVVQCVGGTNKILGDGIEAEAVAAREAKLAARYQESMKSTYQQAAHSLTVGGLTDERLNQFHADPHTAIRQMARGI